MKALVLTGRIAAMLLVLATVARADVKIKTRSNAGGQTTESTTFIKGKRQRAEYGPAVTITQCDLKRTLQLNVPTRTYTVTPFGNANDSAGTNSTTTAGQQAKRRGGVVTTTITTTDTGERKEFFGYTARRIKSSMITESTPNSCNPTQSRMETDGWYIDIAFAMDCDSGVFSRYVPPAMPDGCRDEYRTKQVGAAKPGYPVLLTTTMYDPAGNQSFSWSQEVLEVSQTALDARLFEAPADFREVSDQQSLAAAMSAATGASSTDSGLDKSASTAGTGSVAPVASGSGATGPKREGVIRVGIAVTKTTTAGNITAPQLSGALHESLASNIAGPAIEALALTSEFPDQIEDEARRKECDFILYVAATHKKGGGGGFGGFLKKAAPVADAVTPGYGTGTAVATGAVYSTASVAANVKAKDELTLEYTLKRTSASTLTTAATLKAKAKYDGEDLVTQLAKQASAAVIAELNKK